MPNVNGYVAYNGTHTPIITTGIKNVPVALYSTTTGLCAVALTDATGLYQFTNVPAGNYNIIESWGTAALASPVNYAINAIAMSQPPEVEPPLSALSFAPPANADALDAVTPNLLNVVVASTDITNKNFIDGPVGNKPLTISGFSMVGSNLITAADNGTIGTFPAGTAVFTTNPTAPYPSVTPGFTYTTNTVPSDGFYTVMNTSQTVGPWWGVSDHTTGIETGRYMLVNGANPGAVIFTQNVPVTPNADYLLSAWILNLINSNGYAKPQIGLQVLGSDGSVIFLHKLNDISASNIPIWYQNGFKFNVGSFSNVTVQILSEGPAAAGNDYLIDDVAMYRVKEEKLLSVTKAATPPVIFNGSTVTITVNVANTSTTTANNVFFQDILDPTLIFTPSSVLVNGSGVGYNTANPNTGFYIGNIAPNSTTTVQFQATSVAADSSPVKNIATATYDTLTSGTGDTLTSTIISNPVFLRRPLYNFGQQSTDLAQSIALQQTALAHILNAEGEKIQAMLAAPNVTPTQLLDANTSVQNMIDSISNLECIMKQKIKIVQNQIVGYKTI